ncbi:MAG: hypothetical protein EOQ80_03815 [Mesorhizobium sp.]|uniref:hypothetical protein n=1 Tax=Mesorhizobium sp. TaxID=1871066 RepID=UPI000FE7D5D8|nr:hypothetical protein [Mesorhizobium sp.]RWH50565.1 MAG: hypothetical protein EOQ80_03815 [Mesorhizobium sp.]RWJ39478.1 MAG: hypothetical protein EOR31_30280 [Mesorhizobium sp.]
MIAQNIRAIESRRGAVFKGLSPRQDKALTLISRRAAILSGALWGYCRPNALRMVGTEDALFAALTEKTSHVETHI